jgi:hypothetical protein
MFRSKIDWWLVVIVLSIPGWRIATDWTKLATASPPASFWIAVGALAPLVIGFFPIRYVIVGETVSVQLGLIRWEYTAFRVEDVQSIRCSHNPLASPALSLDRLSVDLGFRGNLLISPKDKAAFLRALGTLDPQLRLLGSSLTRET